MEKHVPATVLYIVHQRIEAHPYFSIKLTRYWKKIQIFFEMR